MYFDGAFRHVGTVDPEPIIRAVESLGENAWSDYVKRQQRFTAHRQTETIPLIFDEDMRHTNPTRWPRFDAIEPALQPVMRQIEKAHLVPASPFGSGYFVRIILTRLSPGSFITPHRDRGDSVTRSHRYHVALVTNAAVDFGIDGEVRHFAPGEIWEINNRKYHAVRNLGPFARVHVILDYVLPGEQVQDPDDGLLIS